MNIEAIYREAMLESIRNAEQWLEDARLLASHGSWIHAFVLRDLAGEEVSKAYACWQVLVGALPTNHPLVRPNREETEEFVLDKLKKDNKRDRQRVKQGKMPKKQISVFSSHSMKYALANDLGSSFFLNEETSKKLEGAEGFLGAVHQIIGELAILKRSEWLYVNLVETDEGLEVTSPMKSELQILDPNFELNTNSLNLIKQLASSPIEAHSEWAKKRRNLLKSDDMYFPKYPKWIGKK